MAQNDHLSGFCQCLNEPEPIPSVCTLLMLLTPADRRKKRNFRTQSSNSQAVWQGPLPRAHAFHRASMSPFRVRTADTRSGSCCSLHPWHLRTQCFKNIVPELLNRKHAGAKQLANVRYLGRQDEFQMRICVIRTIRRCRTRCRVESMEDLVWNLGGDWLPNGWW